jgi:hypothetical protein
MLHNFTPISQVKVAIFGERTQFFVLEMVRLTVTWFNFRAIPGTALVLI